MVLVIFFMAVAVLLAGIFLLDLTKQYKWDKDSVMIILLVINMIILIAAIMLKL